MLEVRGLIMGQCQQHLNSSAIQIIGGANANQHPLILHHQVQTFQKGFQYCLIHSFVVKSLSIANAACNSFLSIFKGVKPLKSRCHWVINHRLRLLSLFLGSELSCAINFSQFISYTSFHFLVTEARPLFCHAPILST